MGVVERFGNATQNPGRSLDPEPAAEQRGEAAGSHQPHAHPGQPIVDAARINRHDAGMFETGDELRFVLESCAERFVVQKLGRQNLQRNRAFQRRRFARFVDRGHPSTSKDADDLEASEGGTRREPALDVARARVFAPARAKALGRVEILVFVVGEHLFEQTGWAQSGRRRCRLQRLVAVPGVVSAQINFEKTGYYVGMGDSVAAGEGALPVTGGYVYDLYAHGVFGPTKATDFANAALRGARSWELRDQQVTQVLCAEPAQRPTVVTITAGANDFLRGDPDIVSIARRVAEAIDLLLNNSVTALVSAAVVDPVSSMPCRALSRVTILVSNYYSVPHPDPVVSAILDAALGGFDQALRFWLQFVTVPAGSRLEVVDLYTPSFGVQGLVTIERRGGIGDGESFDFDVHPTNLGHTFIAQQFAAAWRDVK